MKKYNYIIFISFFFVIALVLVSVVLFFIYSSSNKNVNKNNINIISNNSVNKYDSQYDLKNKQLIFTNYQYKYKLKLPDDWNVFPVDNLTNVGFVDSVARAQKIETSLIQGMKIEVLASLADQKKTLEQQVSESVKEMEVISRRNLTVSDRQAIEVVTDVLTYSITTYFISNDYLYTLAGYIGDIKEKDKYTKIYNEIISTFTFLD